MTGTATGLPSRADWEELCASLGVRMAAPGKRARFLRLLAAGASPGSAARGSRLLGALPAALLDCALQAGSGSAHLHRLRSDRDAGHKMKAEILGRVGYPMFISGLCTAAIPVLSRLVPIVGASGLVLGLGMSVLLVMTGVAALMLLSPGTSGPARRASRLPLSLVPDSGLVLLRDFALIASAGKREIPSGLLRFAVIPLSLPRGSLAGSLRNACRAMAAGVDCAAALHTIPACRQPLGSTPVLLLEQIAEMSTRTLAVRRERRPRLVGTAYLLLAGLNCVVLLRAVVTPVLISLLPTL